MTKRLLMLVVLTLFPAFALAQTAGQTPSERLHAAALQQGNTAYNQGDYEAAAEAYVTAIQQSPSRPEPYRNLARAYFWASRYSDAAAYYDHYLRLAPDGADAEQIKAERRLAAERARDAVYTLPPAQRAALDAFGRELDSGRAYTSGGGGAWALYETVLRTGYAEPALARLRRRLARRLLDEFDAHLVPDPDQLTPRLGLEGWQLQAERLAAARSIADDPVLNDVLAKRSTVVESAIALLTSQWEDAASLARLARTSNPDVDFLVWFEANGLIHAEKYKEALTLLETSEDEIAQRDPRKIAYVRALSAVALQRLGRHDEAAALYLEVLRD